jgi:hypothetical protein
LRTAGLRCAQNTDTKEVGDIYSLGSLIHYERHNPFES